MRGNVDDFEACEHNNRSSWPDFEGGRWLENDDDLWFEAKDKRLYFASGSFAEITDLAEVFRMDTHEIPDLQAMLEHPYIFRMYEMRTDRASLPQVRPRWLWTNDPPGLYVLTSNARMFSVFANGRAVELAKLAEGWPIMRNAREIDEKTAKRMAPSSMFFIE